MLGQGSSTMRSRRSDRVSKTSHGFNCRSSKVAFPLSIFLSHKRPSLSSHIPHFDPIIPPEMQDSTHSRQWLTSPLLEATPRVAHRKKTAEIASLEAEVRSLHAAALAAKKQAATMASSGDVADARSKGAGKKWWWPW